MTSMAAQRHVTSCEVVGSSLCFDQGGGWDQCIAVRRLPGSPFLYAGFDDDNIPGLRDMPGQVLGILPFDIERLENPSGEFDFGPVAISLPDNIAFELRQGSGLPLALTFGAGPKYGGGFEVSILIMGWPDLLTTAPARHDPASGDRLAAMDDVTAWEGKYRKSDPDHYLDGELQGDLYDATEIAFPAGPCVRVRKKVPSVASNGEADGALPESVSFDQYCITPSGRAQMVISTEMLRAKTVEDVRHFEETSRVILDSLRLGFAPE